MHFTKYLTQGPSYWFCTGTCTVPVLCTGTLFSTGVRRLYSTVRAVVLVLYKAQTQPHRGPRGIMPACVPAAHHRAQGSLMRRRIFFTTDTNNNNNNFLFHLRRLLPRRGTAGRTEGSFHYSRLLLQ